MEQEKDQMDTKEVITSLEKKIEKLLHEYSRLIKEKEEFNIKEKEFVLTIANQRQIITEQKKEIEMLRISGSIGAESDKKEIKEKIDDLLREIDTCIGFLNR